MSKRASRRGLAPAARAVLAAALVCLSAARALPQETPKQLEENRKLGLKMLKVIKEQIKRDYYDPAFHGVDVEARFRAAEGKIREATQTGQVLGVIAQAVMDLNDSHTNFIPPIRNNIVVYGWRMQMIGDACYVTSVMPGSDAEAKGLRAGDRVLGIDNYEPTRENLWKMQYYYYMLRPRARMVLDVRAPEGRERQIEILSKVRKRKFVRFFGYYLFEPTRPDVDDESDEPLYHEFGEDLIVCKLPDFDLAEERVDKVMKRVAGHKALVLDLRRNGGGRADALERFVGYFFDREVKVADLKRRGGMKEVKVKPRKKNNFSGRLVVLVDSDSGSAAEVFARVIQLEKRGTVLGDRTAGKVMQSLAYDYQIGDDDPVFYGLTLTVADLIMTDGKSLEHVGVTPDVALLPTASDLQQRRDPVLAHAAALAGVGLDPAKAGDLFLFKEGPLSP
ncbi:MAG: PDZ domain-containing protein [Acidobacteria bacterium]|nr:PDZ domain-containing protein [Acidobacteriota bacterium]MCA1619795.1 PDZ domain-containing protein [Acidobacteriota bacterium]